MPGPQEFLNGFGFINGSKFDGYTLVHSQSTHQSISRYQEYGYEITLEFHNDGYGTYDNLFQSVHAKIIQEHIIYGVRNPYRCIIDDIKYGDIMRDPDNIVIFKLHGHSYRI
jgi:hypothetical protein